MRAIYPKRMTIAEFDAWAGAADDGFTYELHDGVIYAFPSGTIAHGRLANRLGHWLNARVSAPCDVFLGSVSVRRHPERASSVIPDVLVTCETLPPEQIYVTSPLLAIEILSASSVTNDLVRKLRIYQGVPSIEEYLVADSRTVWARLFRRDAGGELAPDGEDLAALDAVVTLRTVGLTLSLRDLYAGILP